MKVLLIGCLFAAAASPLQADLILSTMPAFQTAGVGQNVFEQINVAGVVGGVSNVGAFDLHLDFNPLVLTPLNVSFGVSLGDSSSEAFTSVSLLPGEVQLAEASLLDPATLQAGQPNAFQLARIEFNVVGLGTTGLTFSQTIVDDPFGGKLTTTSIPGTVTGVPEPSGSMLIALGWLVAVAARFAVSAKMEYGLSVPRQRSRSRLTTVSGPDLRADRSNPPLGPLAKRKDRRNSR